MNISFNRLEPEDQQAIIFWIENNPKHLLLNEHTREIARSKLIDKLSTYEIAAAKGLSHARVSSIVKNAVDKIHEYIRIKEVADTRLYEHPLLFRPESGYPLHKAMLDPGDDKEKIIAILRTPVFDVFDDVKLLSSCRNGYSWNWYEDEGAILFMGELIESRANFLLRRNTGIKSVNTIEQKMKELGLKWIKIKPDYIS